jgi:hypothetical protein
VLNFSFVCPLFSSKERGNLLKLFSICTLKAFSDSETFSKAMDNSGNENIKRKIMTIQLINRTIFIVTPGKSVFYAKKLLEKFEREKKELKFVFFLIEEH